IELVESPVELVEHLLLFPYTDETLRLDLFAGLRGVYARNLVAASGLPPTADAKANEHKLIVPGRQKDVAPSDLVDLYLAGTPFRPLLQLPVPFHIPEEARFEHCHIIGGTGHGKTQLMQRMIYGDLEAAQTENRSVVVIDSQGDLINRLQRLALFSEDTPNSLADRLIVIDPADVEFPAALNLFDAHLDRLKDYRPVDRERVLNGVVELYETFFGALLGAELTQKQGVVFKYLARLMLTIPGATIHTLMQLMEDGKPFKEHMDVLEGSARYFFQTEFFHPSFAATKKQILRRLWGVLSTPAFERMFAQRSNKLDLFQAMQDGKIILINTAKDLLKREGSQLFGQFFIAMLAQAALERSTVDAEDRTPTMVYVDEAQEYFGDDVETILAQARKYKVGLTLAHQTLDQLSPRLRSVLHANTTTKCVGGVSAKDARAMAEELHTSTDFIESMRRKGGKTEFAAWIKHQTPHAIRLTVPLGFLERQPVLSEDDYERLVASNRTRYCGTLADVPKLDVRSGGEEAPPARRERPERFGRPVPEPIEPNLGAALVEEPAFAPFERPPAAHRRAPEAGKGGAQHRYLQHLIKQLAEERGFRAVVEEQVAGGHVDVGLHRDDLTIACEISITSTASYEAQNLAKCVAAGFGRVWAIAADQKRLRAVRRAAEAELPAADLARVVFLTTDEMVVAFDQFAPIEAEQSTVRGYKVSVSRKAVSPTEALERKAAIARIMAQAMRPSD
ncbi:MAG TPA: type IV secretion system DNA-binding domain-containing protein, partial [Phenylobacterium sp.]|nr:type IV secretion system DNA-binding domain-containing protein [Phenylobacterium sp.]